MNIWGMARLSALNDTVHSSRRSPTAVDFDDDSVFLQLLHDGDDGTGGEGEHGLGGVLAVHGQHDGVHVFGMYL